MIVGDIYDNFNFLVRVEKMFYDILKRIFKNGERFILVIFGNYDNLDRLVVVGLFVCDQGIIMVGIFKIVVFCG